MHGLLCAPDDTAFLAAELTSLHHQPQQPAPGLLTTDTPFDTPYPTLVFQRQFLPDVAAVTAGSIRLWAERVVQAVRERGPADQPWRLHIIPQYQTLNSTHAGENRCRLISESVEQQLARHGRAWRQNLRRANPGPFAPSESLVQLVLTQPEIGWLSVSVGPQPAEMHHWLSPFPAGEIPVASDPAAPSRAFAKLLEAEIRMGRRIAAGETCVDLGACPGSWSYVALARGAHVIAVDRSPVRADLLRHPRLKFEAADAFKFQPPHPMDWLICDVIAAPERSVQLVLDWIRARWCRHFVVTLKFKGHDEYGQLDRLKLELPALTTDFSLTRLCANKNEACVFGTVATSK